MKNKTISIRLNLEKLTDKKAEEILSELPNRRKSEYIRNAIVSYSDVEIFVKLMKQAITEAMDEREAIQTEKKKKTDGGFNDYLKSL